MPATLTYAEKVRRLAALGKRLGLDIRIATRCPDKYKSTAWYKPDTGRVYLYKPKVENRPWYFWRACVVHECAHIKQHLRWEHPVESEVDAYVQEFASVPISSRAKHASETLDRLEELTDKTSRRVVAALRDHCRVKRWLGSGDG
jgi:hypothetical protein